MDYPILAPWSDPAVKDTKLLLDLADLDTNVAAGVVTNPNFPAEQLARTIASIPLTVDRSVAIGKYATGRLTDEQQVHLLGRAAAKSEAARTSIVNGMTDSALRLAMESRELGNAARRAVAETVSNRAEHFSSPADISDDLRHAVAAAARFRRDSVTSLAIVKAWQMTDPTVMTELLDRGGVLGVPTVGVPGLADDWFDRGGEFRTAAAKDPDINVETVTAWLAEATHEDVDTITALCGNPAIPVESLIEVTLRIHHQRWSTDPDARFHVANFARRIGDELDRRLAVSMPQVTGPVTQMLDGHADLAAVTDAQSGTWSALLVNPHTPVAVKADLLRKAQHSRPILTPVVEQEIRRLAATENSGLTLAEVCGWFRMPAPAAEPTWRSSRAQAQEPAAGSSVRVRMEHRVIKMTTAVVHPDAPHLADVLTKASSWARLFELGENGQTYEQSLATVLADQHATSRADAMASLLGNAFGDD